MSFRLCEETCDFWKINVEKGNTQIKYIKDLILEVKK